MDSLEGLAMAYQGQGKTSEAKQLLARVGQINQNISAPGGSANGGTLLDLGSVAESQGKYTEAESLYKQAISAYEKSPGPYPAAIAVVLGSLGRLYRDQERSEEHTSELQSLAYLVCRLLLEKKKNNY